MRAVSPVRDFARIDRVLAARDSLRVTGHPDAQMVMGASAPTEAPVDRFWVVSVGDKTLREDGSVT